MNRAGITAIGIGIICSAVLLLLAGCVYSPKLGPLAEKEAADRPILICDAAVFTGDPDAAVMEGVDILIEDGRITSIGDMNPSDFDARVIDAAGRMVIPGLIDAHIHITSSGCAPWDPVLPNDHLVRRNLSSYLFAGITTVYDMGGSLLDLEKLKSDIEAEQKINPRFFYAGKMFTRKGGHPDRLLREIIPWPMDTIIIGKVCHLIEEPADAGPAILENKAHGATLTKIMVDQIPLGIPCLYEDLIAEIVKESEKAGLTVCSHVGSESDLLTGLDAGVRFFAHAPYRSSVSNATILKMADQNAVVIPTLVAFENSVDFFGDTLTFTEMEHQIIDPHILDAYVNMPEGALDRDDPQLNSWIHDVVIYREMKYDTVRRMKSAGITIIAGSDSPNVGTVAGGSLHTEMRLLVEKCGFTPAEAVAAATSVSGDHLAVLTGEKGLGRIAEGGPADLVILNGDFREDIDRTQDIHTVISSGRIVARKAGE